MDDGGMGSLKLYPDGKIKDAQKFGTQISDILFPDQDNTSVIASLYTDTDGELFELDVWKSNFDKLIKFPEIGEIEMNAIFNSNNINLLEIEKQIKENINLEKIDAIEIALFRDLSQFDLGDNYYDFHNEFDCIKIQMANNAFILLFKSITHDEIISFRLLNVEITGFKFDVSSTSNDFTIDNIYRGRTEKNGQLIESNNGKAYFYIDFQEGLSLELWSDGIEVSKIGSSIKGN